MRNYEWDAAVAARTNLLIEGNAAAAERLVRELLSEVGGPVVTFPRSDLPAGAGVVLVSGVDHLTPDDQERLMDALNGSDGLQVLCTCAEPLYRRVERGEFLSGLYYRLNMIRIVLPPDGRHV